MFIYKQLSKTQTKERPSIFDKHKILLASGLFNGKIKLYSRSLEHMVNFVTQCVNKIGGLEVLENIKYLISGFYKNNKINIWNCETKYLEYSINIDSFRAAAVNIYLLRALSGGRLACVWEKYTQQHISILNVESREELFELLGHENIILDVIQINPYVILTGDLEGYIKLFNLETGECILTKDMTYLSMSQIKFIRSTHQLLCYGGVSQIKIWDINSWELEREIELEEDIHSLEIFSETQIIIVNYEEMICLVNIKSGKCKQLFKSSKALPNAIIVIRRIVIIAYQDGIIQIIDLDARKCRRIFYSNCEVTTLVKFR